MLELYAEIDVAGSSIHSVAAFGDHYSADVRLSDKDEDYIRDLSTGENEDDDENEIPDGDSSKFEAELDSPAIAVSTIASSLQFLLLQHNRAFPWRQMKCTCLWPPTLY